MLEIVRKTNSKGFLAPVVFLLVFISMLVISGASNLFDDFVSVSDYEAASAEAGKMLEESEILLKNMIVYHNANGNGYQTEGAGKIDTNNDDDDFRSENDTDGVVDDDGSYMRYLIGSVTPGEEKNIWAFTPQYAEYLQDQDGIHWGYNLDAATFSWVRLTSDQRGSYRLEIFDGSNFAGDHALNLKNEAVWIEFQPGETILPIPPTTLAGDIIALYLKNPSSSEFLSYSLSGIGKNGSDMPKIAAIKESAKNFEAYFALVKYDRKGMPTLFERYSHDLLEWGKRPIAPTYLRVESESGSLSTLAWDVNDNTNTGAYYLYRSIDSLITCDPGYFYRRLDDGSRSAETTIESASGSYYYSLCATNSPGSGSGSDNTGKFSIMSNAINVWR